MNLDGIHYKAATSDDEFDQIHRLNYRTFVCEIPQHPDPGTGRLVDKFHHKNRYLVAKRGERVIGMLAVHDQPPYSAADRLTDPSILQGEGGHLLEVRLLALEPAERRWPVYAGLLWLLYDYAKQGGYTHLLISGITQRMPMYQRLGFQVLGPAVLSGEAWFVPMLLNLDDLPRAIRRDLVRWQRHVRCGRDGSHRLTPGASS